MLTHYRRLEGKPPYNDPAIEKRERGNEHADTLDMAGPSAGAE